MKKIFIFGSTGYFGTHFTNFFKNKGWNVLTERVDIRDYNAVNKVLKNNMPDVVLNCTGKSGSPNIDWCEDHKEETMEVNVGGSLNIACVCNELNLYLAQMGSGCIYKGDNNGKGFSEEDEPNFFGSFYSRTKIISEKILKEFNALQLRVRIPIEGSSSRKNAIDKLTKYVKVISVENSFTIVEDFLPAAYHLIENREKGIFNMTNTGSMTQEYMLTKYNEIVDPNKKFTYITVEELEKMVKAERSNCVLNTNKREKAGAIMPPIKGRIIKILKNYKDSLN